MYHFEPLIVWKRGEPFMKLINSTLNQEIRKQWESMCQGCEIDETIVRPEIASLWREMRDRGIDPNAPIPNKELPLETVQKIQKEKFYLQDNAVDCNS